MTQKNAFVLLIDALRYDVLADAALRADIAPNIDRLVGSETVGRVISLASNTQFVMPSMLSGAHPLDYGGHNMGCKQRPVSVLETLQSAGYRTGIFSNCVLYNRDLGFDRGAETVEVAANSRLALMQDIEYRVLEPVRRWRAGEISDAEICTFLQEDYLPILQNLGRVCSDENRAPRNIPRSQRINRELAIVVGREIRRVETAPLAVADRLAEVPEYYAFAALGNLGKSSKLFRIRLVNKIYGLITGLLGRVPGFRGIRFGHADSLMPLFEEMRPGIAKFITEMQQPWCAFVHAMDVHTDSVCIDQICRRPGDMLRRYLRFRRIRRLCHARGFRFRLRYLAALSNLDDVFGQLMERIDQTGQRENTIFMILSDHGATQPEADGRGLADLPFRLFTSDLASPLVVAGGDRGSMKPGLRDSRDIGATLFDVLGIDPPLNFEGSSFYTTPGRTYVISENAGRGFCDLERDVLNFVVTSERDKLTAVLQGRELSATGYYDLREDPNEARNQLETAPKSRVDDLMLALCRERADLLRMRGAFPSDESENRVDVPLEQYGRASAR